MLALAAEVPKPSSHPRYALGVRIERQGDGTWVVNFPAPEEEPERGETQVRFWPPVYGPPVRPFKPEEDV